MIVKYCIGSICIQHFHDSPQINSDSRFTEDHYLFASDMTIIYCTVQYDMSIIILYDIKSLCVRHEYYYTVRYDRTRVLLWSTLIHISMVCVRHVLYSTLYYLFASDTSIIYCTVRYDMSIKILYDIKYLCVGHEYCYPVRFDMGIIYYTVRYDRCIIMQYVVHPTWVFVINITHGWRGKTYNLLKHNNNMIR